jgi:transcriptional regulator with XRE-family HTH domain
VPRRTVSRRRPELEPIGAVLRRFREERRPPLTQMKLGELADYDFNYLGGMERGERNFSVLALKRVLTALGKSWEEFGQAVDHEIAARRRRSHG